MQTLPDCSFAKIGYCFFFLLDRSVVSNHRVVHNDLMIFDLPELVCKFLNIR